MSSDWGRNFLLTRRRSAGGLSVSSSASVSCDSELSPATCTPLPLPPVDAPPDTICGVIFFFFSFFSNPRYFIFYNNSHHDFYIKLTCCVYIMCVVVLCVSINSYLNLYSTITTVALGITCSFAIFFPLLAGTPNERTKSDKITYQLIILNEMLFVAKTNIYCRKTDRNF